jgi:hypothetical protein
MRIVINLIDSEKEQLENNNKDSFKKLEISLAIGRILNEVDKIQSNISEVSNDKT